MNGWIKRILQSRWLEWGLRILLGGVFLYAGASKVGSPQSFADSIAAFRLLPEALINLLALGLPSFELAVGGLLLVGWRLRAAALGAAAMTVVFAFALSSALARGIRLDCGCFGSNPADSVASNYVALGRDLFLGVGAVVLYWQTSPTGNKRVLNGSGDHQIIIQRKITPASQISLLRVMENDKKGSLLNS